MAFRTTCPFSLMPAGIYRKIKIIMLKESSWLPTRICGMANLANLWKCSCGMVWISSSGIIILMAWVAISWGGGIITTCMTISAWRCRMTESQREACMIILSRSPARICCMANQTFMRKSWTHMCRVCCSYKIILVTWITIGGCCSIILSYMAINALRGGMSQCKSETSMSKWCWSPARTSRMAGKTCLWKTGSCMIGICCWIEIDQMTWITIWWLGGEISSCMTISTLRGCMTKRKWKCTMIIYGRLPSRIRWMTRLANLWKWCSNMVWISRCHIIRLMTSIAISSKCCIIVTCMTIIAGWSWMPQSKWKERMIICGWIPSGVGSMTNLAGSSKSCSRVFWFNRIVIIGLMTCRTFRWCGSIISCFMTIITRCRSMAKSKREWSMCECCRPPSWICWMTCFTGLRKHSIHMVWIYSSKIVLLMAGITISRNCGVIVGNMAFVACCNWMSSGKRKTAVIIHRRFPPRICCMADLAWCCKACCRVFRIWWSCIIRFMTRQALCWYAWIIFAGVTVNTCRNWMT